MRDWGYNLPETVAEYVRSLCATQLKKGLNKVAVLDSGCGSGLSGLALQQHGFRNVVGTDLSPEMLTVATSTKAYTSTQVADLSQNSRFESNQFDLVTIVGVMTYLEPDGPCLREMARITKPGGLVVFTHRVR